MKRAKKTMWIAGSLFVICVVVLVVYFSFFHEKQQEPKGTFVKGVEMQWQQNA